MLQNIKHRIGRAVAGLVAPHLRQPLELHDPATLRVVPVVTSHCIAYHALMEAMLRQAVRRGATSPEVLERIGLEAVERCKYELYGREAAAAVGAIEDLIEGLQRSLELNGAPSKGPGDEVEDRESLGYRNRLSRPREATVRERRLSS